MAVCLSCGKYLEIAVEAGLGRDQPLSQPHTINLCIGCGTALTMEETNPSEFRVLKPDEMQLLQNRWPRYYEQLRKAQEEIRGGNSQSV